MEAINYTKQDINKPMKLTLFTLLFACSALALQQSPSNECLCSKSAPYGWSFEFGGQYTWMSLTTPPTFHGNTGGVEGQIGYQIPWAFYGNLRSVYNIGPFSSSQRDSSDNEWYTEIVGGYCCSSCLVWVVTPYAGVALDFYNDHQKAYSIFAPVTLHYRSYYAIFGVDVRYVQPNWYIALQADCLPVFHQYLSIGGLSGTAYKMDQRVGAAVRLPVAWRLPYNIWVELTPYYRLLPIGRSSELSLPERTLNQWGAFLSWRYYL